MAENSTNHRQRVAARQTERCKAVAKVVKPKLRKAAVDAHLPPNPFNALKSPLSARRRENKWAAFDGSYASKHFDSWRADRNNFRPRLRIVKP